MLVYDGDEKRQSEMLRAGKRERGREKKGKVGGKKEREEQPGKRNNLRAVLTFLV